MFHKGLGFASLLMMLVAGCGGGGGQSAPAPAPNRLPVANAGPDQTVQKRANVTLSGTASSDPDNDALVYRWTQVSGTAVSLGGGTGPTPVFTAPTQSGVLTFSLVVNDGKADSATDTVEITIGNRAPIANAGADGLADTSVYYTLDGTASSDPDGDALVQQWVQLSGPPVTLSEVSAGLWRFTTPPSNTRLEFALVVSDGESQSAQDTVVVTVQGQPRNNPPVAVAGASYTMPKRSFVALDGYGYDPEGASITYEWRQVSGPAVSLSSATEQYPAFTAPAVAGVLEFDLRVSDGQLTSQPSRLVVTIENFAPGIAGTGISPDAPHTVDTLSIDAQPYDPDEDPLTTTYAWSRNGVLVPAQTGNTFPSSLTARDDVIAVRVTVSDGEATATRTFTQAILDSPPVFTAPTSLSANYGDTVSFTVTVSDADGDAAGPFEVHHAPDGLSVDAAGHVTWQVTGPMFDTKQDFHWGVGLRDYPGVWAEGVVHVTDAVRQQPLARSSLVVPQQSEQLVVADLQGDGISEIVVANGRLLAVLNKSGAGWTQTWVSPFQLSRTSTSGIESLAVAQVTGDTQKEIFVASAGRIAQLTGADHHVRKLYDWAAPAAICRVMRVADLEGDGLPELVCLRSDSLYGSTESQVVVFDAASLAVRWSVTVAADVQSMAVGNVDHDAALEIVLAPGMVFDGATHSNEWLYGPGFGDRIDAGDLDGDGVAEIVSMQNWGTIKAFSAVSRSPLAELSPGSSGGIAQILLADLDANGRAELIVGDAQWGSVRVFGFDGATLRWNPVTSIDSQDHGVSAIAVGNVDSDPAVEIVWGTGVSHSGQDIVVVGEYQAGVLGLDWSSENAGQLDGPFLGGMLAEVSTNVRRLMYLSPRTLSGYGGSRLLTLNPVNGEMSVSGEIGSNWAGLGAIDVADYDHDGVQEAFVASASLYDGFLATYDFAGSTVEWQSPNGFAQGVAAAHADVTGDGAADFIAMGGDGKISVIDALHSTSVWQSTTLTGGGKDIAVADLDLDGRPEIIALTGNYLFVFGKAGWSAPYLELGNVAQSGAVDLLVADIEGDSKPEILVMSADLTGATRLVRIYDANRQLLRVVSLPVTAVTMAAEPGTGAHRNLLIGAGLGNYYYYGTEAVDPHILAVDSRTGSLVWESPAMPGEFSHNSLNALDTNGDEKYEMSWGSSVSFGITR